MFMGGILFMGDILLILIGGILFMLMFMLFISGRCQRRQQILVDCGLSVDSFSISWLKKMVLSGCKLLRGVSVSDLKKVSNHTQFHNNLSRLVVGTAI